LDRKLRPGNLYGLIVASAVLLLGAGILLEALRYDYGSLLRMGTGFMPFWLGVIVIALSCIILFETLGRSEAIPHLPIRAVAFVAAGVLGWILTVERFGLVPACFILVVISSLAEPHPPRPRTILLSCILLSAGSVAIFIYGLSMPFRAFNW